MRSLFPDMEREIRDDRKAAKREQVQRARDYLKDRDLQWLINYLLEHGPSTEHVMMIEIMDEEYSVEDGLKRGASLLCDLYALCLVRKLWRRKLGVHPCSGENYHAYGVRGVHQQ